MKNLKYILIVTTILFTSTNIFAQTGGPGPATGVPIDGLSGIIMMGLAAIFGKKFINKDK